MERLHTVPPLYGCHISVSGISVSQRAEASKIVEQLGGQYSAELTKSCTHLLAKSGESHNGVPGPKIQFALKWAIPIVNINWLYSCQARNSILDGKHPEKLISCSVC